LTASSQDLAAASLHCNKNKLARSTTIINQNPPKICAVQNYSWIQLSQAVLRDLASVCALQSDKVEINIFLQRMIFSLALKS